jgi:hypothetical protein
MRRQKRAQCVGQKFGERVGVGQHAHLTGLPARIGAEVLAQPFGLRQDRARMLEQRASRLRRRHAGPSARQKRCAERLFHLADSRTRCGECKMRAFRAMRDAARLHDMAKQAEIHEVEAHLGIPILRD